MLAAIVGGAALLIVVVGVFVMINRNAADSRAFTPLPDPATAGSNTASSSAASGGSTTAGANSGTSGTSAAATGAGATKPNAGGGILFSDALDAVATGRLATGLPEMIKVPRLPGCDTLTKKNAGWKSNNSVSGNV